MDGPGHDKECADNDNETYIFAGGMLNPSRTVEGEEVIAAGGRGQERTQFLVMPFPMLLQDERKNCNSDEQNRERREERRRRLHDCGGHRCRLLVGALVFGQEKSEPSVPGQSAGWDRRCDLRALEYSRISSHAQWSGPELARWESSFFFRQIY